MKKFLSVPGSLTLKKEIPVKRAYKKRKVVSVPELLSVRAELTSQTETPVKNQEVDKQEEFEEFLILNKSETKNVDQSNILSKSEENEIHAKPARCIEIIDQTILRTPVNAASNTISYNISKNSLNARSVLVLTTDGN